MILLTQLGGVGITYGVLYLIFIMLGARGSIFEMSTHFILGWCCHAVRKWIEKYHKELFSEREI